MISNPLTRNCDPGGRSAAILKTVIPSALLVGVLVGRWWWTPLLVGVAWALVVAIDGSCRGLCSISAFGLGTANAAIGMVIYQAVRALLRRFNRTDRDAA